MYKNIFLISIITFLGLSLKAQDSLGVKFFFGMQKGVVYNYRVINQEISRNMNNAPIRIVQDTVIAKVQVMVAKKDGYGIKIDFRPNRPGGKLPDAIYSIPLRIALDSNGNALAMINHFEYQKFLYKQIDSFFYSGVYDSLTVAKLKAMYKSNVSIENLIYKNFEDFFTIFSRQYREFITYSVGKEIYHPFGTAPFIAGGETIIASAKRDEQLYMINTKIGNTPEERRLLINEYENYLKRIGRYNPQQMTPAVDLNYNAKYLFEQRLGVVREFYLENGLRVGDEYKVSSSSMKLLNL